MIRSRLFPAYLVLTSVLCGALVMLVEVLGSRVIGPFFGVGLFVWTSLITVALLALAAGYSIGGRISDRFSSPGYLYAIIMLAGLLVLLIPPLQGPVIKACQLLGLRMGTLVSTLILFGPSLFLLGFVSPYVVRIATAEFESLGTTVGRFYAFSTLGSCLGTLLTGFFLIPYFGVNGIFLLAGGLLLAIGCGYFLLFQRKVAPCLSLLVPILLQTSAPPAQKLMDDGTRVTRLHSEDSYYGNLKVLEYAYQKTRTRELTIDGLVQGGIDASEGNSVYAYPYFLQWLPRALNPTGSSSLMIGVGAGIVPRWYSDQGVQTDVVDIDPKVIAIAKQYFGFYTNGETFIEDARYYLTRSDKTYDYMLLDVFSGDTTPNHVLSREAMALIKARISEGGVFAANLVGDLVEDTFSAASIVKTVATQFDQVQIYTTFDASRENPIGNYLLIAYDGPLRQLAPISGTQSLHRLARDEVLRHIGKPYPLPVNPQAIVLTDNYNPIDFFDLKSREEVRDHILRNTDMDMLL